MKKLLLFVVISLTVGLSNLSFGQVSGYAFTNGAGAFSALTAGYTQHTTGTTDEGVYAAVPIGFTFVYNCVSYTTVSINNNGYLGFGSTSTYSYPPLSSESNNNLISALGGDLVGLGTGSLRSKTTGSSPNRVFTVEWQHYKKYLGSDDYSFQIILTETSNTIQMIYTAITTVAGNQFEVGLRGATSADFNNRTKAQASDWNTGTTAGVANTDVMATGNNIAKNPHDKFTWTPSPACSGTPAAGTANSPGAVCSGVSFNIPLTGYTAGCGVSYQWQSASAIGGPYSDVAGQTSATFTGAQTATTYYRCITTCANGGATNTSSIATVTMNAPATCYCSSTSTSSTSYFDAFSTTGGIANITNNASGYSAGGYGNFTGLTVSQMQTSSINFNTTLVGTTVGVNIWVDWNQDGDFVDAGENVYSTGAYVSAASGSFAVPLTALTGNTRMRIRMDYNSTNPSICGSITRGETEDYTFNVVPLPNCTGVPTGGTTVSSANPVCPSTSVTLSVTGSSTATGLVYQWQSAPAAAGPWTNIPGETGATLTIIPGANTYYRREITCTLGGGGTSYSSTLYQTIGLTIACYCTSTATSTGDMDILRVTYGTINNTSASVSLTGSQGTATGTAGMYSNWTASTVPVPNIQQNVATAFTVQIGGGSPYSHRVDVYIDLNQDGDFNDVGESYPIFAYANPSLPNTTSVNITIPCYAALGITTMRVVCVESSSSSACGTYTWGETEDYRINITAGGVCAGTPTAGTAVASVATISSCAAPTSTLSLTGASTSCGINYQWQSAPAAVGPWTNISGATSSFYVASPSSNTYFRCILTCTISGLSSTSSSVLVSVTISIPPNNDCSGATTLTVNAGQSCTVVTSGTVNCSSASSDPNTCWGTADDDVWFKFVATSGAHDITISNVAGSTTDMYHSVYSGTCGALGSPLVCSDPNTSSISGLTIGATYYVRVYTYTSTGGQTSTFDICITSQPNCATPPNCNLNYTLSSIAHAPVSYATGTTVTFSDDRFAPSYSSLGFSFCFDGITYTDVLISSNGYLIFPSCYSAAPTETSVTVGGYSPWAIDGPAIPNNTDAPRNAILVPWQDIDPGAGGTTRYQTVGSAPNRIFIVKYDNIAMYSCNSSKFSAQVMLYETTNNIEVHIKEKTICATWNGGDAILGLHNYNGTMAVTPAGHNYPTDWSETNTAYRFTSNCAAACAILPIKLVSFNAEALEMYNLLTWTTSTEINNDYFVVESSTNMIEFKEIGSINGAGNSNIDLSYQFIDRDRMQEKAIYYRLRQVDFDGTISYSNIVAVKRMEEGEISIYPNPAKETLFLDINSKKEEQFTIRFVNVLGAVVQENILVSKGTNTYQSKEFKQLQTGIYFVQLLNAKNETIKNLKIVKE